MYKVIKDVFAELDAVVRRPQGADHGLQFGQNLFDFLVHSEASAPSGWSLPFGNEF